jgi:succinate dehydrogenase/fumarate reductase-like Fe-S protein
MNKEGIMVRIRTTAKNGKTTYRDFSIPMLGEMNVLNAVQYVHTYIDPTVSYRSSCRRGVCAACLMLINGRPRLACETLVEDGMEIDPLFDGRKRL